MSEEGYIQLVANYADWKAVKKIKIDDKASPEEIMYFLMSLSQSFDSKVEFNLKKALNLTEIENVIKEAGATKKAGANEFANLIEIINSRKTSQAINAQVDSKPLSKDEKEGLRQACLIYLTRKVLGNNGIAVDYSQVKIPGTRVSKKAKVE